MRWGFRAREALNDQSGDQTTTCRRLYRVLRASPEVVPLHLLVVLLRDRESIVAPFLIALEVNREELLLEAQHQLDNLAEHRANSGSEPLPSSSTTKTLEQVLVEAVALSDAHVAPEHLLLGIFKQVGDPAQRLLERAGINRTSALKALTVIRGGPIPEPQISEPRYKALDRYARDLTELARHSKLDPVIGRHREIRRVIQVLSRRTKNNPVLIGEPGVGKTAIVEGLAQRIHALTSNCDSYHCVHSGRRCVVLVVHQTNPHGLLGQSRI